MQVSNGPNPLLGILASTAAQPTSTAAQPAASTAVATAQPTAKPDVHVANPVSKGQIPAKLDFQALPSQPAYEQAVKQLESRVEADLALQDTGKKQPLYLRQNYQSRLLTQPQPTGKGTVVLFHGYTAGPWQFKEAEELFFKAGYNVYVPRIPGHGFMKPNGTPTGEKMVDTWEVKTYDDFVAQVHADVSALGGPVQAIGLSGGANLALRMGERFSDLKSVTAMAPYIGPDDKLKPTDGLLHLVDRYTPIKLSYLLDMKNYNKNTWVSADNPMPHTQGTLNNAYAMFSVGSRVDKVQVPMQIFTTEGDVLAGEKPVEKLLQRSGGLQKHGWYHFEAPDKVPHAMASPMQNTQPGQAVALWQMVFATLERGELNTRLPK
jgi:esterase/lipase